MDTYFLRSLSGMYSMRSDTEHLRHLHNLSSVSNLMPSSLSLYSWERVCGVMPVLRATCAALSLRSPRSLLKCVFIAMNSTFLETLTLCYISYIMCYLTYINNYLYDIYTQLSE